MPEATAEFKGYAVRFLPDRPTLLQQIPEDKRTQVLDVIDDLADDPNRYPERLKKSASDPSGQTLIYIHSDSQLELTYTIDQPSKTLNILHIAYRLVELKRIFVSYSHTDAEWRDLLQMYLIGLNVTVWDDTKIQPGADWFQEIEAALKSAHAAVFLVSQNFLASQFIQAKELPNLLERAKQDDIDITWIAVRPSTVMDSPLGKYQGLFAAKPLSLLSKAKREQALVDAYQKIKQALS